MKIFFIKTEEELNAYYLIYETNITWLPKPDKTLQRKKIRTNFPHKH